MVIMKRGIIFILILLLLVTFVFGDVILDQDDFEDGIVNQSKWENTSLVTELNGYLQINGSAGTSRAYLRNPQTHSSRTIVGYFNLSARSNECVSHCPSLQKFTTHSGGFINSWVGATADTDWGKTNNNVGDTINNARTKNDENIEVWVVHNNTHICFKSTSISYDDSVLTCSSTVNANKSYYAMMGMLDVTVNTGMKIYDFVLCEDTDNDFNCTVPVDQPLNVEWDNQLPVNNTFENDNPLTFFYNISEGSNTQCDFYTNLTGSLTINQTNTGLSNGINSFNYSPETSQDETVLFQVKCNITGETAETSIKTMHIDLVNVLINVNIPQGNNLTTFNEDENSFSFNISYANGNLDIVMYNLFYPNGSLFQTNTSDVSGQTEFTIIDSVTFPTSRLGVWSLDAFGNDSTGASTNKTVIFSVLDNDLRLEWELVTPLNGSTIDNETEVSYNYNLVMHNLTSTNCLFFENKSQIDSDTLVSSGNYTFNVTYNNELQVTKTYKVNCSSSTFTDETTIKEIIINNEITPVITPNNAESMTFVIVAG